MNHIRNIILIMLLYTRVCYSQQDPLFSMYMADKALINPAFTGSSNWAVGTIKYRQQFAGFNGRPVTQTINFHSPIQQKHIGIGFKMVNDKIAVTNNFNASLLFSYHLNFAGGKLSAGIDAGILKRKTDFQKLILSQQGDNSIPVNPQSYTVPDASWGLYYQKKKIYLGISQYHFLHKQFGQTQSHLYNHIYGLGGITYDFNKTLSLESSILLKYQPAAPIQFDLNTTLIYNDKFGAGLQYRTGDAILVLFKFYATENLRLYYSYDFTISRLARYSSGSHELVVSYGIKLPPPPSQKIIHTRYYF